MVERNPLMVHSESALGHDPQAERVRLVEDVFAPGNLVHGTGKTHPRDLYSFFTHGIQSGRDAGYFHYTPDTICFSLMDNEDLPGRYLKSEHYGPRWHHRYYTADDIKIAFIISREKLLETYPDQVYAVGSSFRKDITSKKTFWNTIKMRRGYILDGHEVYDIPIRHPGRIDILKDEVRLYPSRNLHNKNVTVTPDMFLGIVALPSFAPYLQEKTKNIPLRSSLPLFSPQCELITYLGATE